MRQFKIAKVERMEPELGRLNSATDLIRLISPEGDMIDLILEAECCSRSFFEVRSVSDLESLVGQTLLHLEPVESSYISSDEIRCHALLVFTDQRSITVDWRNESNGYYDGSLLIVDSRMK